MESGDSQWILSELEYSQLLIDESIGYRLSGELHTLGVRLRLPQTTIATSQVYLHRVSIRRPLPEIDHIFDKKFDLINGPLVPALLFLAAKVEERPLRISEFLTAWGEICLRRRNPRDEAHTNSGKNSTDQLQESISKSKKSDPFVPESNRDEVVSDSSYTDDHSSLKIDPDDGNSSTFNVQKKLIENFVISPEDLYRYERLILRLLCFDLKIVHPYQHVSNMVKKLSTNQVESLHKNTKPLDDDKNQASKISNNNHNYSKNSIDDGPRESSLETLTDELVRYSWLIVNDSLRTTMCIRFSPELIATAAISLAASRLGDHLLLSKIGIKKDPHNNNEFIIPTTGIDRSQINKATSILTSLYGRKSPLT